MSGIDNAVIIAITYTIMRLIVAPWFYWGAIEVTKADKTDDRSTAFIRRSSSNLIARAECVSM